MTNVHPLTAFRTRQQPPITKTDLARLLNVSKATITRWETGRRLPDQNLVARISKKTGIPVHKLRPDLAKIMRADTSDPPFGIGKD